jgi:hypothetical protein
MHPEAMRARVPSAISARTGLAKFVAEVEIVLALDFCRIAINTGE